MASVVIPPPPEDIPVSIGIIFPPPDIRGIVDKTAQFVAKNGIEFEQRVLADPINGKKFTFLLPDNPYRPYYEAKVQEFLTGEETDATRAKVPSVIVERQRREAEKKQKKESLLALTAYAADPLVALHAVDKDSARLRLPSAAGATKALTAAVEGSSALLELADEREIEPPPDDVFSVAHPHAAALDINVIKLTSQFVARNGQKFLVGLGQRERGNPQFAFLRATHPLFPYFTSLVDAYTKCLAPDSACISRLKADAALLLRDKTKKEENDGMLRILQRVYDRYQWESKEAAQREEREKRAAEERESMATLDWHDFAVVEVIDFTEEDDHLPLGAPWDKSEFFKPKIIPPLTTAAVPSALAAQMVKDLHIAAVGPEDLSQMAVEPLRQHETAAAAEKMEVDEEAVPAAVTPVHVPPPAPVVPPVAALSNFSPLLPVPPPIVPTQPPTTGEGGAPLVVVKDYVRQARKRQREAQMQKCPITGQMVPTERMSEHLRIVLLDPRWKEEKDAVLAKARKESALVDGADFGANLAEFVVNRPDLFGSVEDEVESTYLPGPKQRK